ncbi:hypothetical protein AC249_AIPGENE8029 [Exaiptasia diaphana]|nr:hypothetical protein AC249_AIPGENE8029 [Exaiptasia diaphana]
MLENLLQLRGDFPSSKLRIQPLSHFTYTGPKLFIPMKTSTHFKSKQSNGAKKRSWSYKTFTKYKLNYHVPFKEVHGISSHDGDTKNVLKGPLLKPMRLSVIPLKDQIVTKRKKHLRKKANAEEFKKNLKQLEKKKRISDVVYKTNKLAHARVKKSILSQGLFVIKDDDSDKSENGTGDKRTSVNRLTNHKRPFKVQIPLALAKVLFPQVMNDYEETIIDIFPVRNKNGGKTLRLKVSHKEPKFNESEALQGAQNDKSTSSRCYSGASCFGCCKECCPQSKCPADKKPKPYGLGFRRAKSGQSTLPLSIMSFIRSSDLCPPIWCCVPDTESETDSKKPKKMTAKSPTTKPTNPPSPSTSPSPPPTDPPTPSPTTPPAPKTAPPPPVPPPHPPPPPPPPPPPAPPPPPSPPQAASPSPAPAAQSPSPQPQPPPSPPPSPQPPPPPSPPPPPPPPQQPSSGPNPSPSPPTAALPPIVPPPCIIPHVKVILLQQPSPPPPCVPQEAGPLIYVAPKEPTALPHHEHTIIPDPPVHHVQQHEIMSPPQMHHVGHHVPPVIPHPLLHYPETTLHPPQWEEQHNAGFDLNGLPNYDLQSPVVESNVFRDEPHHHRHHHHHHNPIYDDPINPSKYVTDAVINGVVATPGKNISVTS